jgi:hypothetical protein
MYMVCMFVCCVCGVHVVCVCRGMCGVVCHIHCKFEGETTSILKLLFYYVGDKTHIVEFGSICHVSQCSVGNILKKNLYALSYII